MAGIPDRLFHTTVTIRRRTITLDAIGAPTETWTDIANLVKAIVQPAGQKDVKEVDGQQGKEYTLDAKAWVKGTTVMPKSGDRILDGQTAKTYEVVGVKQWFPANASVAARHHYELELIVPRDNHS